MKRLTTLSVLLFSTFLSVAYAQLGANDLRIQIVAEDGPLELATVYLPDLEIGGTTDDAGFLVLEDLPQGIHELQVSYVGYFSQTRSVKVADGELATIQFYLTPQVLEEVVVTGTMREIRRSDSPIPVDVISAQLFRRNPTPNIFESVGMVSGVQPVLNCNVCNTGDIQINGIEGVYTQVLLDGMPIVSGLGTVYGLMGIPNSLIDRIEVVKGPAGALYGSEAMAGQINIITKDAVNAPKLAIDLMGTTWGEANMDAGMKINAGQSAAGLLGLNAYWFNNPLDKNADGFTDVTQQKRVSLFNKWQWQRSNERMAQLAARYVWEDRWGGETNWTSDDRGGDEVYGESIFTNRLEVLGTYELPTSLPLILQASYNFHDQDSYYGDVAYMARQEIAFGQLYLDQQWGRHQILAGAALRYTNYNDNTPATETSSQTTLPGVFVQDEITLGEHNHLLTGVRMDWHPEHGGVWSPRIGFHHHLSEQQSVRISAGSGFRVVSLFTEDHAALSGAREVVIAEALRPERSWSGNLTYNLQIPSEKYFINVDASAFYTRFFNRILPDYDTDPQQIIYSNLDGESITRGITLQVDYSDGLPVRINAGVTYMDVFQTTAEGEKIEQIRAPRWSGTLAANYTHPKTGMSFDLTGNWFGPQRLPIVPNDFRPEYSPWYAIVNLQVSRKFRGGIEIYGGVKNLLDFVPDNPILRPFDPFDQQADDPVNNPNGYTFDPTYNYASLQGIRGFLGLRYSY